MSRKEAIGLLKLNIEFGVDEALSKTTRNRFRERSLKVHSEAETHQEGLEQQSDVSFRKDEIEKDVLHKDKVFMATKNARECRSVSEIISALKKFPYFSRNSKSENSNFYEGSSKPSILIFREPEIYNMQSDNERRLFDKNLLFKRIFNSIEATVDNGLGNVCASIETFPANFDITEENKSHNTELLLPFLLRYIEVIQPKAIIIIGDSWLDHYSFVKRSLKGKDPLNDMLIIDFPSLDVLGRAPKRKKDIWQKILELKSFLN